MGYVNLRGGGVMLIIEARKGKQNWISGIFKNRQDADAYMITIPDELRQYQRHHRIDLDFPFFIIEKSGFEFVDEQGLINRLDELKQGEAGDDEVFFNIYRIESDYKPPKPGTDYMGIIQHDHVTLDFIDWYVREGIEFLRRRGLI